jgi:hypothetical protein
LDNPATMCVNLCKLLHNTAPLLPPPENRNNAYLKKMYEFREKTYEKASGISWLIGDY